MPGGPRSKLVVCATRATSLYFYNRVLGVKPVLVCDLQQEVLKALRRYLIHVAARGTEEVLTLVSMLRVVARHIGLSGLQAMDKADTRKEIQMTIGG